MRLLPLLLRIEQHKRNLQHSGNQFGHTRGKPGRLVSKLGHVLVNFIQNIRLTLQFLLPTTLTSAAPYPSSSPSATIRPHSPAPTLNPTPPSAPPHSPALPLSHTNPPSPAQTPSSPCSPSRPSPSPSYPNPHPSPRSSTSHPDPPSKPLTSHSITSSSSHPP